MIQIRMEEKIKKNKGEKTEIKIARKTTILLEIINATTNQQCPKNIPQEKIIENINNMRDFYAYLDNRRLD